MHMMRSAEAVGIAVLHVANTVTVDPKVSFDTEGMGFVVMAGGLVYAYSHAPAGTPEPEMGSGVLRELPAPTLLTVGITMDEYFDLP
jgi:hypothetical protein